MKRLIFISLWVVFALASCSKSNDEDFTTDPPLYDYLVDFEGTAWNYAVADKEYGNDLGSHYTWQDAQCSLGGSFNYDADTDAPQMWAGGSAVSAYCSTSYTGFTYGKDMYLYGTSGVDGSKRFLVVYGNKSSYGDFRPVLTFGDGTARSIAFVYVAPTAYFAAQVIDGGDFVSSLAEGAKIMLQATSYDESGVEVGSAEMVLAEGGKTLSTEWRQWNLEVLGRFTSLKFNIVMGDGSDCYYPTYAAIDNIAVRN